ncbi:MAG: protein-tyrosine phosphatase family protein [Pseudomonadota bacterium]
MSDFEIFALPVAGGLLGIAPLPGRDGHREEDLATLRDWDPALVISMTTGAEHSAHGMADLGRAFQAEGIAWVHFPVEDMSVPTTDQSEAWTHVEQRTLSMLHSRSRVLIHCLGGCGRSGMAALRLMICAGESPDVALNNLRAVRRCAVETAAQIHWACDT